MTFKIKLVTLASLLGLTLSAYAAKPTYNVCVYNTGDYWGKACINNNSNTCWWHFYVTGITGTVTMRGLSKGTTVGIEVKLFNGDYQKINIIGIMRNIYSQKL